MRIQHNITAMNSYRNFSANNSSLSKNLEKLSSGYNINRAGDDAAGLAISEKMRVQISGLEGAKKNAKDGISLIQTAEGALTETHDMLNRMVTLAEQSANGTYQDELDREQLQKEITSLKSEIDRIADSTNFNGLKLLDGSLSGVDAETAAASTVEVTGLKDNNTIASTYGVYESKALTSANVSDVAVGDTFSMTVKYTDANGDEQEVTKTLRVKAAPGASSVISTDFEILNDDGTTTALATSTQTTGGANEVSASGLAAAFKDAFNKDEAFKASFAAAVNGDAAATDSNAKAAGVAGAIAFTARQDGTSGPKIESVAVTYNDASADGGVSTKKLLGPENSISSAEENDVNYNAASTTKAATDEYTTYDLSKATVWQATGKNDANNQKLLDNSVFEVNGEKFVFIKQGAALTTGDLAALDNAGVKNYVVLSGSTTPNDTDVYNMAQKIAQATGLEVTQGNTTTSVASGDGTTGKYNAVSNTFDAVDKFTAMTSTLQKAAATATSGFTNANTSIKIAPTKEALEAVANAGQGLTLQIGDTSDEFNRLTVSVGDMHSEAIGIGDVDISTQEGATTAIDKIKAAVNVVSDTRGTLGALQNRLDHTINNIGVMTENIQAAESNIRDTDVAEEMMKYTKNNILNQSAQAMLAQANQLPQGVLQLLG